MRIPRLSLRRRLTYPRSAVRRLAALIISSLAVAALGFPLQAAQAAAAAFVSPTLPHVILAFPQRDFVSATGYQAGVPVHAELWRNGLLISRSTDILPQDDPKTPGFDGIVEVNHPGGGCWLTVTPDMRPGDAVLIVTPTVTEGTIVANVTAGPAVQTGPTSVAVHGTAQDVLGNPLPVDQLEQRLIAKKDRFDLNRRRDLRASAAGINGTLAYDAPGSIDWTASYTGLDAADMLRALSAESRILWRGANPLLGNEGTIYEVGAVGGPTPPCTAPLEAN